MSRRVIHYQNCSASVGGLHLPRSIEVLGVLRSPEGTPRLYYAWDPMEPEMRWRRASIAVYATGEKFDVGDAPGFTSKYAGSYTSGSYVWHVYLHLYEEVAPVTEVNE